MRVNYVKKSRKEWRCSKCGATINKGDSYRWWQHAFSPAVKWCSKCGMPKESDLASSDKVQRYCVVKENVDEIAGKIDSITWETIEDIMQELSSALQEGAEEVRSIGEEYSEGADNMEQSFPNGSSVIDRIREKAEACESWADAMENAVSELENIDLNDSSCETCNGDGTVECTECDDHGLVECEKCEGRGFIEKKMEDGAVVSEQCDQCLGSCKMACPNCSGDMIVDCPDCNGDGMSSTTTIIAYIQSIVEDAMADAL